MTTLAERIQQENQLKYKAGLEFGFIMTEFDKNGRLIDPTFHEKETIEFKFNEHYCKNYVTLGRGNNGKWCYGISAFTGAAGVAYGISIFSTPYQTRQACLKAALEQMIAHHKRAAITLANDTCGNYNEKFSKGVLEIVQDRLDTLIGRKQLQLSLFA